MVEQLWTVYDAALSKEKQDGRCSTDGALV